MTALNSTEDMDVEKDAKLQLMWLAQHIDYLWLCSSYQWVSN